LFPILSGLPQSIPFYPCPFLRIRLQACQLDHGYFASSNDPKAKLVRSQSLAMIGAHQIADENGVVYPADIIILANGFLRAQLLTPMTNHGDEGTQSAGSTGAWT
jgi:hypothetical protein